MPGKALQSMEQGRRQDTSIFGQLHLGATVDFRQLQRGSRFSVQSSSWFS
jgi:hypothetical protein